MAADGTATARAGRDFIARHGATVLDAAGRLQDDMTSAGAVPAYDAPAVAGLPQGSIVQVEQGVETIVHRGSGGGRA